MNGFSRKTENSVLQLAEKAKEKKLVLKGQYTDDCKSRTPVWLKAHVLRNYFETVFEEYNGKQRWQNTE